MRAGAARKRPAAGGEADHRGLGDVGEPVADDLATLALDLLVDEAGYSRSGPNLLLIGAAA